MSDELLRAMFKKPESAPDFIVGQKVRVISRIDVNMPRELSYWLNTVCEVLQVVPRGFISREWCYQLRHPNGETCEFKGSELDLRYKCRATPPAN